MDPLTEQIKDILDEQKERYQTLRRTLLRQRVCLRQEDVVGVGTATEEIREAMRQVAALEARLTPLVARWRERPAEREDPIPDAVEAVRALILELQDLRAQNEGLARSAMDRVRQEMVTLSVGANAVRGYGPRPSDQARFLDRKH
jgi:hypothetical protein